MDSLYHFGVNHFFFFPKTLLKLYLWVKVLRKEEWSLTTKTPHMVCRTVDNFYDILKYSNRHESTTDDGL